MVYRSLIIMSGIFRSRVLFVYNITFFKTNGFTKNWSVIYKRMKLAIFATWIHR